jgi:hypothetical protein
VDKKHRGKKLSKFTFASALLAVAFLFAYSVAACQAFSFPLFKQGRTKSELSLPELSMSDLHSDVASPEAMEIAGHLGLTPLFHRLEELRGKMEPSTRQFPNVELREEYRDIKDEITERIEQAHLEVDYVQSELAIEIASQSELLQSYSRARDDLVNRTNVWSFRTNGILWAVAEGLSIPTYRTPRYSIPSGATGIIAGIVPSLFSIIAVRESSGFGYERKPYPNMLAQLFQYSTVRRTEVPDSVLDYLRATPAFAKKGESRADWLINRWAEDKNLSVFSDRSSKKQIDAITGEVQTHLTIELVSDRLTMLQQLSALINQMNRPLLELMMVVRGTKHCPVDH